MSTPAATERRVALREQFVVDTKFSVPVHADAYFEIHLASHPTARPLILATRDSGLHDVALSYYGTDLLVDVWYVAGRPQGTHAVGILTQIRLAESCS